MSLFGKLFGNKGQKKAPTPQEACQKLREIEEVLNKKVSFLEKKINAETSNARKAGTKDKRAALMALRRKKQYQRQLDQIDGTLTTIEYQIEALESAGTNVEVLNVIREAGAALRGANQGMNVDAVHDTMDDLQEQHEIAKEISDAISNPAGFGQDIDMDELEAELEELEQEEVDRQLLDVGTTGDEDVTLPTAPTTVPIGGSVEKKTNHDKELEELADWAS